MKLQYNITLFFLFVLGLVGCVPDRLDRAAYIKFVSDPDHGCVKRQEFGELAVEVFYQPLEFVYLKERKEQPITAEDYTGWKKTRQNYEYYIVRLINKKTREIAEYKSNDFSDYAAKLDYLVSSFQNDINMICGKDTLPCKLMHYERSYGLSGNNNFNVVFDRDSLAKEKTLTLDLGVFELGQVKFTFSGTTLKDLPHLNI